MANPDISLVVEMPEERATARNRVSFLQKWKKIFVASCLFAVVLDPLFLYVPMMKDDIKCLQSDRNLKIAALVLRSFTDLFYIFDIIVQVYTSDNFSDLINEYRRRQNQISASRYAYCRRIRRKITFWSKSLVPIAKTIWGSYVILIDILAILPLPQVAILIFFSKMRDLRSLNTMRMVIMNLFVLLQYVPRLLRIYLSCKEFKTTLKGDIRETPIWIKGVLNLFMYILASHVFGAIWYFFAIQRVGICWHDACRKENGCSVSTFGCHDHHTFRNIAFLNDLCPISPMNATLFDFGIYTKVLQSGIPGSTNYFQKFSYCFWLGLRHLSSLGSNLEPSIDGWESLFAAFISIIGLLLFLYLIGNLQTYMQLDTVRIEAHRHNMKVERKMKEKDRKTELWLSKYHIPKELHMDIKSQIVNKVRQELEENRDVDMDKILSILPSNLQSQITAYMDRHKMEVDRKMEEKGRDTESWLSKNGIPKKLINDIKPQIMDKVRQEVEEDKDADMDKIFSILPSNLQRQITKYMPMTGLKQVPMFRYMHESVLKAICGHLKPTQFVENDIITEEGEPLQMMLFIVDGLVSIEKRDGHFRPQRRGAGELWGEELLLHLLHQKFSTSLHDRLPLATYSAKTVGDVEACVVMATDLRSVVYEFGMQHFFDYNQFNEDISHHLRPVNPMRGILRFFTLAELKEATNNFATRNEVGRGHSSTVYRTVLDKQIVAIKMYKFGFITYDSLQDVINEVAVAQTTHINVVRFLGYYLGPQAQVLVFEYIRNVTLFEHIHGKRDEFGHAFRSGTLLPLQLRLKIASETARALAFLHSRSIIHGNVKTTKILLDEKKSVKLSDFRRSRLVPDDDANQVSTVVKGTFGYQQYFQSSVPTKESDVYSFGVVLAELLTSRKAFSSEWWEAEGDLASIFISSMEEDRLNQILDPEMIVDENEENLERAKKAAHLAKRCLAFDDKERPSMEAVDMELQGILCIHAMAVAVAVAEHQRGEPSFSSSPK